MGNQDMLGKVPKLEAKEAKIIPYKKPKRAPINKHNKPATGSAKTEILKYKKKKVI